MYVSVDEQWSPVFNIITHMCMYSNMFLPSESGNWTTPGQYGATVLGRTAHSSVYSPDSGLIYVYGGHTRDLVDQLLSYDPISHVWRELAASGSHRYLHSAMLVGSALMVTYGGCSVSGDVGRDCLSNDLDVYNIGERRCMYIYMCQYTSTLNSSHR